MRKHIWFLMIFAVIGSISTTHLAGISGCNLAFACECGEPKSPGEAFSEAAAVFSGKVTAIAIREGEFEIREKIVSMDVGRAWKGVSNDTVTVVTGASGSADCGFPFEENREYLVYAYGGKGGTPLETNGCLGTTAIENAQTDLAFLDPGYVPVKSDEGNPIQSDGGLAIGAEYFGYVPLIIGFGAAIARVLAFLLRPRK